MGFPKTSLFFWFSPFYQRKKKEVIEINLNVKVKLLSIKFTINNVVE